MTRAHTSRTSVRFGAIVLAALLIAVLAASCGGGKKHAGSQAGAPKANAKHAALKIGAIDIESWGPDIKLAKSMQKTLLKAAQTYVDTAVQSPLDSGQLGASYGTIFDNSVRSAATGADRNALTDEGVGKVTKFDEKATPVALSALVDGSGAVLYLATKLSLNVRATTPEGVTTITRDAEFTFAPTGKDWLVTAYRVRTIRKLPAGATTTTVASAGRSKP